MGLSCRKSGERVGKGNREVVLNGEAVKKVIHNLAVGDTELPEPPKEKRRLKALYVEVDEDHGAGQDKKNHLPRLIYLHEGKEKVGKERYKLKRPYYLGGLYPDPDELWLKVLSYIEDHYDLSSTERIYLCGDGGGWMKKRLEFLPKSVFVLDLCGREAKAEEGVGEVFDNLPALRGPVNQLTKTLKALSRNVSLVW